MHVNQFEELVDPYVLERGAYYFEQGNVIGVLQLELREFSGQVTGMEDYTVLLRFDASGELLVHHCTCPYRNSPVCKHKAAVLYYIRHHKLLEQPPSEDEVYHSIKSELKGYSAKELRQLLLDRIKMDRAFKEAIAWELGLIG